MSKLVADIAWQFQSSNYVTAVQSVIEDYGRERGVVRAAALAVQVGEYIREHYPSTVYRSWVVFMDFGVDAEEQVASSLKCSCPTLSQIGAIPDTANDDIDSTLAEIVDRRARV